ncbi:unnamed protein product, partial [Rotaria sp. Silwood1]
MGLIDTMPSSINRSSLISLKINNSYIPVTGIEQILSLTPSVTYLKLINHNCPYDTQSMSNGVRWEEIIQSKLPELEKFEFFFAKRIWRHHFDTDVNSLIKSFRRPFWIDFKRWLVCCEYSRGTRRQTALYTIPL